jgi:hypothetical protein
MGSAVSPYRETETERQTDRGQDGETRKGWETHVEDGSLENSAGAASRLHHGVDLLSGGAWLDNLDMSLDLLPDVGLVLLLGVLILFHHIHKLPRQRAEEILSDPQL